MKKMFVMGTAILILCLGCPWPGAAPGQSPNGDAPETLSDAAARVLQSLPELKMVLPGSLSAPSGEAKARAIGDSTPITAAGVEPMKSGTWYNLQKGGGNLATDTINKIFTIIKEHAEGSEIPVDEVFEIVPTDAQLANLIPWPITDSVTLDPRLRFLVSGDNTEAFTIYCRLSLGITEEWDGGSSETEFGINARMDIASITGSGAKEIKAYALMSMVMGGADPSYYPLYIYYNGATGNNEVVLDQGNLVSAGGRAFALFSDVQDNGTVSCFTVSKYDRELDSLIAVYGDDNAGGLGSLYYSSWDGDGDGIEENHFSYSGEYYDQNGNLIRRDFGEDTLSRLPDTEEMTINLKDIGYHSAPETINERSYTPSGQSGDITYRYTEIKDGAGKWVKVAREYDDNGKKIEFSTDNGESWINHDPYEKGLYIFKAEAQEWSEGDTVFNYEDWASTEADLDEDGQAEKIETASFCRGYTVPISIERFGETFYSSYGYPLDQLLPLSEEYRSLFDLVREETGSTTFSWSDGEGNEHETTVIHYTYYLNKTNVDRDKDGSPDVEDPIAYEEAYDIDLDEWFSKEDAYYYDAGTLSRKEGVYFRTTGSIPPYFATPNLASIDRVGDSLDNLLTQAYNVETASYAEELGIAEADPTKGLFSE